MGTSGYKVLVDAQYIYELDVLCWGFYDPQQQAIFCIHVFPIFLFLRATSASAIAYYWSKLGCFFTWHCFWAVS